ncbi:hypothetical protein ABLT31_27465 [Ammoniphilus sp. 3BR4]
MKEQTVNASILSSFIACSWAQLELQLLHVYSLLLSTELPPFAEIAVVFCSTLMCFGKIQEKGCIFFYGFQIGWIPKLPVALPM